MSHDANGPLLSRKQAAQYLSTKWFKCGVSALAKYARLEIGPPYRHIGPNGKGTTFYSTTDLDEWAQWFLVPPKDRTPRGKNV